MTEGPKTALGTFASAVLALLRDPDLAYADPSERAIVARLRALLHRQYEGG